MTAAMWATEDSLLLADIDAELQGIYAALDATDWHDQTRQIVAAIAQVGAECGEFSANHVRPRLPDDINTARIGRAFALCIDRGWLVFLRYERSLDRPTHGKRIGVYLWVGATTTTGEDNA